MSYLSYLFYFKGNYRYRSPGFSEKFASTEITRGKDDLLPEKRMECDAGVMLNTEVKVVLLLAMLIMCMIKSSLSADHRGISFPENLNNVYGCGLESECYLSLFPWLSMANILTIMRNKIYSDSFFPEIKMNYLPHSGQLYNRSEYWQFSFRHQFVFSGGYYTGADNISDDFYKPVPELGLAITLRSIGPISISYRLDNYLKAKLYQSEGEGKSVLHTQIYHGTPKPGRMHVVALQLKM